MENFEQKKLDFENKIWSYLDGWADSDVYFHEKNILKTYHENISLKDLENYYYFSVAFDKYLKQNFEFLDIEILKPLKIWEADFEWEKRAFALLPFAPWIRVENYKTNQIFDQKYKNILWENSKEKILKIIQQALVDFSWNKNIYISELNMRINEEWKIIITDTWDSLEFVLNILRKK